MVIRDSVYELSASVVNGSKLALCCGKVLTLIKRRCIFVRRRYLLGQSKRIIIFLCIRFVSKMIITNPFQILRIVHSGNFGRARVYAV